MWWRKQASRSMPDSTGTFLTGNANNGFIPDPFIEVGLVLLKIFHVLIPHRDQSRYASKEMSHLFSNEVTRLFWPIDHLFPAFCGVCIPE